MNEGAQDGSLPVSPGGGDTLGSGGPFTHPVSAPHEFSPETGTPAFSKGKDMHAQRRTGHERDEEGAEERASAQAV